MDRTSSESKTAAKKRKIHDTDKEDKAPAQKKQTFKLDSVFAKDTSLGKGCKVYKDYSCMLNQTNLNSNNNKKNNNNINKFYIIQIAEDNAGKSFYCLNHWGRVGETGEINKKVPFEKPEDAIKAFEKKFKKQTKNEWSKRANFNPVEGGYTYLEMDDKSDDENGTDGVKTEETKYDPSCTSNLDPRTNLLQRLIFNIDMFTQQMTNMELDGKTLQLGILSKTQIAKGLESLLVIEAEQKKEVSDARMRQLSSRFYTMIPHNFGRNRPPVINTPAVIQQKKEMLITLSDIELTQSLLKNNNPMDALGCSLACLDKTSKEFKWIDKYSKADGNSSRRNTLLDVWQVDRDGEDCRFGVNSSMKHRKLLWHRTNVAVVAATLNSGLRIMPHSGGRVGRGIYFTSEHAKSTFNVDYHNGVFEEEANVGFMFLVEVALGKEQNITRNNGSQEEGFDSVVARGRTEPNPKDDKIVDMGGNKVIVPMGQPTDVPEYQSSDFTHSEYIVYREDQARMRYLLKFSFE